jgi:hypothetical protein
MQLKAETFLILVELGIFIAGAQASENTPPKGFTALFNGKDLTHWQGVLAPPYDNPAKRAALSAAERQRLQAQADKLMRQAWKVEDGALAYNGKGFSLSTVKEYGDFELYVDWKIEPGGDSGIYLRGCPQVQIWDAGKVKIGSGGLYNNKKHPSQPLEIADKPVGQWNTFYIKMEGDKATVKLNGKLVVDHVPLENYWEPDQPVYPRGPIELQHHGSQLWFKNIYLRELARPKPSPPPKAKGGSSVS